MNNAKQQQEQAGCGLSRTRSSTPVLDVGPPYAVCGDISEPDARGVKRMFEDGADPCEEQSPPNIKEQHAAAKAAGPCNSKTLCTWCYDNGTMLREKLGIKCPGCTESTIGLEVTFRHLVLHTALLLNSNADLQSQAAEIDHLKKSVGFWEGMYNNSDDHAQKLGQELFELRAKNRSLKGELESLLRKNNIDS